MSALKSMTGTKGFKQLPDEEKRCSVHNQEKYQSLKFLDQVKKICGYVPWPLMTSNLGVQVVTPMKLFRNFPNSLESFQTVWKVYRQCGKFPDSLQSFRIVWKVSG